MSHPDQTVISVQLEGSLKAVPSLLAWSLIPAALALLVLWASGSFPRRILWGSSISLLAVLFISLILAFMGWSPTLTGGDRWLVVLLYLGSMLITVGVAIAGIIMAVFRSYRSLWPVVGFGMLSFTLTYFVYPLSVATYCDYANRQRTDGWRWIHCDHMIYLLDPQQGNDSQFGGLIEIFPPYFSLPAS